MIVRLAGIGGALVVYGLVNLDSHGVYAAILGAVGLLAAGALYLRDRKPTGATLMVAVSLLLNGVVPLVAYLLLRPHVSSDAVALAIALAVPVVGTIGMFAWRRRVDVIGVAAVVAYGIALVVLVLSGGNAFVLKLQEAVVTGPLGLVLLGSVAFRRPLLHVLLKLAGKELPGGGRAATVLTAILGTTMVLHAAALTVLALVLPTSGVLAVSRIVGIGIIGLGVLVLLCYRNRVRPRAAASCSLALRCSPAGVGGLPRRAAQAACTWTRAPATSAVDRRWFTGADGQERRRLRKGAHDHGIQLARRHS